MLRDNANTNENNFQQHVSSIRQLRNKLFTDENGDQQVTPEYLFIYSRHSWG